MILSEASELNQLPRPGEGTAYDKRWFAILADSRSEWLPAREDLRTLPMRQEDHAFNLDVSGLETKMVTVPTAK